MNITKRTRKVLLLLLFGTLTLSAAFICFLLPYKVQFVQALLLVFGSILLIEGFVRMEVVSSKDTDFNWIRLAKMIQNAKHRILLTTGRLNSEIYINWHEGEIKKKLESKLQEGIEIEIISSDSIDKASLGMVKGWLAKFSNFRLYLLPGNPFPHGVLIDDREIRLERSHASSPKITSRENVYIKRPGIAGSIFLEIFEKYKSQAKPILATDL